MTQIATTIEQSKRLMELGVPVETADMRWDRDTDEDISSYDLKVGGYCGTYEIPAWSLPALLGLLYNPSTYQTEDGCTVKASATNGACIVCHSYGATYFEAVINMIAEIVNRGYPLNYSNNGENQD